MSSTTASSSPMLQPTSMLPSSEPSSESATSATLGFGSGSGSSSDFGHVSAPNDHVFVVHSQHSLENKRPPEIDNKTLARQRRKRTRYGCNAAIFLFSFQLENITARQCWK